MGELSMLDKNGKLRELNDIVEEISAVYDELKEEEECGFHSIEILKSLSQPEQMVDIEGVLNTFSFSERRIMITEEITSQMGTQIFELINFWNSLDNDLGISPEEREPIKMIINTPGGDLIGALTIIDAMNLSKTPIYTYDIGAADSGGFFIFISGDKRFIMPNASCMFHEGSAKFSADAHKFQSFSAVYKILLKKLKKITLNNTRISEEKYEEYQKDDWTFFADEAIQYGVADEIIEDILF